MQTLRSELKGEIQSFRNELKGEITRVELELKGEITRVELELKGEIKRLEGDIKSVEAKLDGFDKRISYQEFASKGVFVTVLGGILLTLARFFVSFDPKKFLSGLAGFLNSIGLS
jgi:predicted phage tail protein